MIGAKAMDPVLGVDIHIIQPPGPVPPLPVPHPFVGMLVDPMDFAPIIGATVMINGMPRATAVGVVVVTGIVLAVTFIWSLVPPIVDQGGRLLHDNELGEAGQHELAGLLHLFVAVGRQRLENGLHVLLGQLDVLGNGLNEFGFRHHLICTPKNKGKASAAQAAPAASIPLTHGRFGPVCLQRRRGWCRYV